MDKYDFILVGGGIIGLASALRLQERFPGAKVAILEKEDRLAAHQSGHNSGVIHAGVYYEPGSLKARLCRAGLTQTLEFCRAHSIPYRQCGKLIIATNALETKRLQQLYARATNNGVACEMLEQNELQQIEPNVTGFAAIRVHDTGIVDYTTVCERIARIVIERGGIVELSTEVIGIREERDLVRVDTADASYCASHLIACAGLQADRIARLAGLQIDFAIIPFRGDFYRLPAHRRNLVSHLIYPVPDPSLPFLGVHITATIDTGLTVGPSAMLAFAREGYGKMSLSLRDTQQLASFPGLWRLLARYPRAGLSECLHAFSRRAYLAAVRRYCPGLGLDDLSEHQCGIRAQAVTRSGELVSDFLVRRSARMTHICNAPSPAATAALPIADAIAAQINP